MVAIVTVVLASAVSAVAAKLITSRQIKNGTIQRADLSKGVRSTLQKRGPQGPAGAAGIGKSYYVSRAANGVKLGAQPGDVITLQGLAPGSSSSRAERPR